jgi:ERCC4-type nuclease
MATVTITVDVRERRSGMPALLSELGAEVVLVTLAVGDYAFGDRVVERKSVTDLLASLKGDRLWGQVGALRRDPRRAYLMVEGAELDAGPVPPRALRGAILKVLDNGIRVLRTSSRWDSAIRLDLLARQEERRLERRRQAQVGRRPIAVSPVGLLAAIPGIGPDQARALVDAFGSIGEVAAASEDELRSVPGIGPERARTLLRTLNHSASLPAPLNAPSNVSPAQAGETWT